MSTMQEVSRLLPPTDGASNGWRIERSHLAEPSQVKIERKLLKNVQRVMPFIEAAVRGLAEGWRAKVEAAGQAITGAARDESWAAVGAAGGIVDGLAGEFEGEAVVVALQAALMASDVSSWNAGPDDPRRVREAQDARLFSVMSEDGLDLGLACARLGLDRRQLEDRAKRDPFFARDVEQAFLRGTVKVFETVWKMAKAGNMKAASLALTSRDPGRFVPVQRIEISEGAILGSEAFGRVVARILGALGPGHVCEKCGGCECRRKAADELATG